MILITRLLDQLDWLSYNLPIQFNLSIIQTNLSVRNDRATAEAVAAPKTKRDRVAELHYITRGAGNVEDVNFEMS